MAQNGGGVSSRRILASTTAASRLASTTPPNSSPPPPSVAALARAPQPPPPANRLPTTRSDDQNFVTLGQPRPDVARRQNEYIETPLRPHRSPAVTTTARRTKGGTGEIVGIKKADSKCVVPDVLQHTRTIVTQPSSVTTFKKDVIKPNSIIDSDGSTTDDDHTDSIICTECGRCKCESCKNPKKLPSKWICRDGCLCSAECLVDYASCMCCVKGLFYHCANMDDDDGGSCADNPCSCVPRRRCLRWTSLSFVSLLLPCLWCYWPMKGCMEMCEMCYSKVTNHGCTCPTNKETSLVSTKSLLDSD